MSDQSAGQEGPTPDFTPGWFAPRPGNPDPATREAVRIVGDDVFPINFLRSTEMVHLPRRPQLGVCIGNAQHSEMELAVPPGYWIVRDSDGDLANWRDEDFKAKYTRTDRDWTPPVERGENPHIPADYKARIDTAQVIPRQGEEAPDGWQGTPPAEGTRRKLIFDTIHKELISGAATDERCLEIADAIEGALLRSTIDNEAGLCQPLPEGSPGRRLIETGGIHEQLDEAGIRRYDDAGTPQQRILTLQERVEVLLRSYEARQETIDGLAATVSAQADKLEERVADLAKRVSRDDAWVASLVHRVAGAVIAGEPSGIACRRLLAEVGVASLCERHAQEELAKGVETADDSPGGRDPAATIKFLEGEVERLLGGREEARSREGRFAEERDCAFALLRWLLPVTVAKRID